MSVYRPTDCAHYRYDFEYRKKRYVGNTHKTTEREALVEESRVRESVKRRAEGLEALPPEETPRFETWAAVYYQHASTDPDRAVSRPERIADLLRVVLRFWGPRPDTVEPKFAHEPYKDLRLGDPIARPELIVEFEDWMTQRGRSGQTKNQYRSAMNQMFVLAGQPKYRRLTGVTAQNNPFAGIFRSKPARRRVTIEPEDLRKLLAHASYHLRLAVAIGALAPKLRLGNILALRWTQIDRELRFITVDAHKTAHVTGRPLVIPVSGQLKRILDDARRRSTSPYVVTYRGQPIKSLRGSMKGAATAAGLPYGRSLPDGLTFHTLRHTAATLLAELDVAESKRKSVLGHERLSTTQWYTHLRPVHEIQPLEALSTTVPIEDLVVLPWRRATRKAVGEPAGPTDESGAKPHANADEAGPMKRAQSGG